MPDSTPVRSFGAYLQQAPALQNAAGDFVRDARRDEDVCTLGPSDNWQTLKEILLTAGATPNAVLAAKTVWQRYRRWLRSARS